jgi:hypothetical protein
MSGSFNAAANSLVSSGGQTLGSLISAAAWFFPLDEGGAASGIIVAQGPWANERVCLRWDGSSTRKLRIQTAWGGSGTVGWNMVTGFAALNKWLWAGLTYDLTAGVDPTLYTFDGSTFSILTEGSGLTAAATLGTGTTYAEPLSVYIGNSSALNNGWNGLIGEVALWKRLLSAAEMAAVAVQGVNVCPDHFNYLPLDGGRGQNLGASGTPFTLSAVSVGENPPIRPAGRRG